MKLIFRKLILMVVVILLAYSCEQESSKVPGVHIIEPFLYVAVESEASLDVDFYHPDKNRYLLWKSVDTSIARVDSSGTIYGVAQGKTSIIGMTDDGEYYDTCIVNVIRFTTYNFMPSAEGKAMCIDTSGIFYCGTLSDILKYDGMDLVSFIKQETSNSVEYMKFDSENNLWAYSGYSLLKFDGNNWITFDTLNNSLLSYYRINDLAVDQNNRIWLGLKDDQDNGAGVLSFDGSNWKIYSKSDGLAHNYVYNIVADKNNNIWVATKNGVSKYDGINWHSYLSNLEIDDKENIVFSIGVDYKNNIWITTLIEGVYKFDGTDWINYDIINKETNFGPIRGIDFDSEGNVWVGSNACIAKFDGSKWNYISYSILPTYNVRSIVVDGNGIKWIRNTDKIYKLED